MPAAEPNIPAQSEIDNEIVTTEAAAKTEPSEVLDGTAPSEAAAKTEPTEVHDGTAFSEVPGSSGKTVSIDRGVWSAVKRFLDLPPVKAIIGDTPYGWLTRILITSGALTVFIGNTYAQPSIIGVALIVLGGATSALSIRDAGKFTKTLIIPTIIVFVGIVVLVNAERLQGYLLKHVSSFNAKTLHFHPQKRILNHTIASTKGALGTFQSVSLSRSDSPQYHMDNTASRNEVESLLSQKGALYFLVGPAGINKEGLTQIMANTLSLSSPQRAPIYDFVFYLDAEQVKKQLDDHKDALWPEVLAAIYGGKAQDAAYGNAPEQPEYYSLLMHKLPCIILFSNLERLKNQELENRLASMSYNLVANNPSTTVVIASRMEAIVRLDRYGSTFESKGYVHFVAIEPVSARDDDLNAFFKGRVDNPIPHQQVELLQKLSQRSAVTRSLVGNRDFARDIARHIEHYSNLSNAELCNRVLLDVYPTLKPQLSQLYSLAFDGSQSDSPRYPLHDDQAAILVGSNIVDVEGGDYVFSPPILQSYLALQGLREKLKTHIHGNLVFTPTLARDVEALRPLPPDLSREIQDAKDKRILKEPAPITVEHALRPSPR